MENDLESLGLGLHPRRMFKVYDQLPALIERYRLNRVADAAGRPQDKDLLPVSYTRKTPQKSITVGTEECSNDWAAMLKQQHFLSHFAHFWLSSRQIFSFAPELCEALRETKVDDVPWGEINLPHRDFYLGFYHQGNPTFVSDGHEYIIDGAYIVDAAGSALVEGRVISMFVTARPTDVTVKELVARDERLAAMPFIFAMPWAKENETVAVALDNCALQMSEYASSQDESVRQVLQQSVDLQTARSGHKVTVPPTHYNQVKWREAKGAIEAIIPLILNCIFYLTQRPEDATQRYEAGAPEKLVAAAQSGVTGEQRAAASRRLEERGFSVIQFVANAELRAAVAGDSGQAGQRRAVHLRRGHWHRFAHGPGRTLRKWKFVAPVLVNADGDGGGDLGKGTIHQVNDPSS